MKKTIYTISLLLLLSGCQDALNPMKNGNYTEENYADYPSVIRGLVDRAHTLMGTTYGSNEYVYLDCAADNGVASASTNAMRQYATNTLKMTEDPFYTFWERDYTGIALVNKFLKDRIGISTQYLLDAEADSLLRHNYQGDAFAIRAWYQYDLLLKFGGRSRSGKLLGTPIILEDFSKTDASPDDYPRKSYDECVAQILRDCDSALVYLPLANRNWLAENPTVQGSSRWGRYDQVSVKALKALTYLLWASDAYNPDKDITRWQKAAEFAAEAIQYKLTEDGAHGFNPAKSFAWTDPNSPEIYWCSRFAAANSTMEELLYPNGFLGSGLVGPTQELVDAFPMANGYPITDPRSGYDEANPFAGRDPRLYATIFCNGDKALRAGSSSDVMYTFDTTVEGKDAPGLSNNSVTGYYLKKFLYSGWNASDMTIQKMPRAVFFITWRDMCLAFAEAANRVVGPTDASYGLTAKEAIAYLRNRQTTDGAAGLGSKGDPYLDECAQNREAFEALVRNERRIETCFEGKRLYDLARWDTPANEMNTPVHAMIITRNEDNSLSYRKEIVYERNYSSIFLPIPYHEVIRASSLEQNEGWNSWQ